MAFGDQNRRQPPSLCLPGSSPFGRPPPSPPMLPSLRVLGPHLCAPPSRFGVLSVVESPLLYVPPTLCFPAPSSPLPPFVRLIFVPACLSLCFLLRSQAAIPSSGPVQSTSLGPAPLGVVPPHSHTRLRGYFYFWVRPCRRESSPCPVWGGLSAVRGLVQGHPSSGGGGLAAQASASQAPAPISLSGRKLLRPETER